MPSQRFAGKVALITGATRGIGLAIASGLAREGARLIVSSRKADAVQAVEKGIRDAGGDVIGVPAHVGRADDVEMLAQRALAAYGAVDILVNNAATNPVFGPVEDTNADVFDKIMAVNVKGPFELAKRLRPSMKERGGGAIVNISSVGGVSPEDHLGIYSVSKAALISLTRVMAKEWGKDGIRANAICPGLIQTHFSSALWQNEALTQRWIDSSPVARMGQPDDVAAMALFLSSNESSFCTGGVYMVDGGYTI